MIFYTGADWERERESYAPFPVNFYFLYIFFNNTKKKQIETEIRFFFSFPSFFLCCDTDFCEEIRLSPTTDEIRLSSDCMRFTCGENHVRECIVCWKWDDFQWEIERREKIDNSGENFGSPTKLVFGTKSGHFHDFLFFFLVEFSSQNRLLWKLLESFWLSLAWYRTQSFYFFWFSTEPLIHSCCLFARLSSRWKKVSILSEHFSFFYFFFFLKFYTIIVFRSSALLSLSLFYWDGFFISYIFCVLLLLLPWDEQHIQKKLRTECFGWRAEGNNNAKEERLMNFKGIKESRKLRSKKNFFLFLCIVVRILWTILVGFEV